MEHATGCERCGAATRHPRSPWCQPCWSIMTYNGKVGAQRNTNRRCPMWRPHAAKIAPEWVRVPHPVPSHGCRLRWCIACGDTMPAGSKHYHLKRSCSKACQQIIHRYGWGLSTSSRTCRDCGDDFKPTGGADVRCVACRSAPTHAERDCLRCGERFSNLMGGREHCRSCSPPGTHAPSDARRDMWRRKNRARRLAARRGGEAGRYTLAEIAERDGCRCHLCGRLVDMSLSGMDPKGPNIDHLVPISDDGEDVKSNVALAHRQCNVRRGVGGVAQLRLVG